MKRHSSIAAAIVLLLCAGSAYAQSRLGTFKIPFNFVAGERVLPAGGYRIREDSMPGMLQLSGSDGKTILVFAGNIQTLNASTQTKIVFHRYANQYFLAQLWVEGQNGGREVQIGRQEREIAKKSDPKSMALVASPVADRGGK